jgi:integrase
MTDMLRFSGSAGAITFADCADRYIAHQKARLRTSTVASCVNTLRRYVYPVLGDREIQKIDKQLVMQVIERIWTSKPNTANRVRGCIAQVLEFATAVGYRQGENPAQWRHLKYLLPHPSKLRRPEPLAAMDYRDIATFVAELGQQKGSPARALEFAILTAARTGEVTGATWDQIDIKARLWTIPAGRIKIGKEHRVPLSDAARAILQKMAAIRQGDFVFPGNKAGQPLSDNTVRALLKRSGRADVTVHGFRRTFAEWARCSADFPPSLIQMALGHVIHGSWRFVTLPGLEKRRPLMEAWAKFCDSPTPVAS